MQNPDLAIRLNVSRSIRIEDRKSEIEKISSLLIFFRVFPYITVPRGTANGTDNSLHFNELTPFVPFFRKCVTCFIETTIGLNDPRLTINFQRSNISFAMVNEDHLERNTRWHRCHKSHIWHRCHKSHFARMTRAPYQGIDDHLECQRNSSRAPDRITSSEYSPSLQADKIFERYIAGDLQRSRCKSISLRRNRDRIGSSRWDRRK